MKLDCFECGAEITAADLDGLGEAFLDHARANHEWPYPDQGIRNYAEATQRLTGGADRLAEIGEIEVHPVTVERLDDWRSFFEHDAFVGKPEWAACFCIEPHVGDTDRDPPHWTENRDGMIERLRARRSHGYLAYVDGKPAGWVNASKRSEYELFKLDEPPGDEVIGISCFVIAPPYRRHGVAAALLDRVIADAPARGAAWIEAYPFNRQSEEDAANFRGPLPMYEERGFEVVQEAERHRVVRKRVPAG